MMARGIFLETPVDQIERIRDQALANMTAGTVLISWSVGETSSGKQAAMSPADILDECRYALKRLAPDRYGAPITKTAADFS